MLDTEEMDAIEVGKAFIECDLMRSQLYKVNKYELVDVIVYEGVVIQIFCNGQLFKYIAKNENLKIHCEEEGFTMNYPWLTSFEPGVSTSPSVA